MEEGWIDMAMTDTRITTNEPFPRRRRGLLGCLITACVLASMAAAGLASPAAAAPILDLRSYHTPTNIPPGETALYEVVVSNEGDAPTTSEPLTLTVTLPSGLTTDSDSVTDPFGGFVWGCTVSGDQRTVSCQYDPFSGVGPIPPVQEACEAFNLECPLQVMVRAAPDASGTGSAFVEACGGGSSLCASESDPMPVSPTPAPFGIHRFDGEVFGEDRTPVTQAGSHPWALTTRIEFNNEVDSFGRAVASEDPKSVEVDLPPGLIVDPSAPPTRCSREVFGGTDNASGCPVSSQVGIARVRFTDPVLHDHRRYGVYNLEPSGDAPAQLGFQVQGVPVVLTGGVQTGGDYSLTASVANINQSLPLATTRVSLWGVPADPSHDPERGGPGGPGDRQCSPGVSAPSCPTDAPRKPFLTLPTDCSAGPLTTSLRSESWQNPGAFATASFDHDVNGVPMEVHGCERLPFDASISVQPTNPRPDSPSGYRVELRVPQNDNPDGLATAHLKKAVVALPQGVSLNPSSAHGLAACSPAQIGLDSAAEPTCPDASRIGTVEIDTPLLKDALTGFVYVAKQNDNPFGTLLAIYIVARGPGVLIKLPGKVEADPQTGQLTTKFDNNPQLPFSSFRLRLKGGPTAPLVNPPTCGERTVTTALTPWSGGPPAHPSDTFSIDCPGLSGFSPDFTAGLVSPVAGAFSPFLVRVSRQDREQNIDGLDVELPEGLLAKIKGVPLCDNARANVGTCPEESRIGTVTTGAGAGASPFFIEGKMFLTEGYKGGPFGLSIVVPAVAGPFDLGNVVVRAAIHVDPVTAEVSADSDPLPTIHQGIPLRVKVIQVDVDREEFMKAPTSCEEHQVRGTVRSLQGSSVDVNSRFQVGGCRALAFSPRLGIRLLGRRQMRDGGHPGLKAVLRQPDGQAGIRAMAVKLPRALALDPNNAQELCEFEAGQRVDCPESSIIGRARAISPLLNRPLTGPVYFVKGIRIDLDTGRRIPTLPTLLIPLEGEIDIVLRARSRVRGRRANLVSIFRGIPDAPVSRFALRLQGGRNGILATNTNVCDERRHPARVVGRGHNGKRTGFRIGLRTPCRRSARLTVGRARLEGRRLTVAGRVNPRARRNVRVVVRCAGASVTRVARPSRRGFWKRTLTVGARCANASKARVVARYDGDPTVGRARTARAVSRG